MPHQERAPEREQGVGGEHVSAQARLSESQEVQARPQRCTFLRISVREYAVRY